MTWPWLYVASVNIISRTRNSPFHSVSHTQSYRGDVSHSVGAGALHVFMKRERGIWLLFFKPPSLSAHPGECTHAYCTAGQTHSLARTHTLTLTLILTHTETCMTVYKHAPTHTLAWPCISMHTHTDIHIHYCLVSSTPRGLFRNASHLLGVWK